jgi:hypothetical protein
MHRAHSRADGWWKPVGASLLTLIFAACGLWREEDVLSTPTPSSTSAIVNGSFEDGAASWWGDPAPHAQTNQAHSGGAALELGYGQSASQFIVSADFPEFISGYYRLAAPLAAGEYL